MGLIDDLHDAVGKEINIEHKMLKEGISLKRVLKEIKKECKDLRGKIKDPKINSYLHTVEGLCDKGLKVFDGLIMEVKKEFKFDIRISKEVEGFGDALKDLGEWLGRERVAAVGEEDFKYQSNRFHRLLRAEMEHLTKDESKKKEAEEYLNAAMYDLRSIMYSMSTAFPIEEVKPVIKIIGKEVVPLESERLGEEEKARLTKLKRIAMNMGIFLTNLAQKDEAMSEIEKNLRKNLTIKFKDLRALMQKYNVGNIVDKHKVWSGLQELYEELE